MGGGGVRRSVACCLLVSLTARKWVADTITDKLLLASCLVARACAHSAPNIYDGHHVD
jgi:hypothetical protein